MPQPVSGASIGFLFAMVESPHRKSVGRSSGRKANKVSKLLAISNFFIA
jgi:hypothetical protein